MEALVNKDQQFNPECQPCHVTGFRQSNGFYALTHTPSQPMLNVQCETCHGPAREHAEAEQTLKSGAKNWMKAEKYNEFVQRAKSLVPATQPPESLCLNCHDQEHDDNFSYSTKLRLARHRH